MWRRKSLCCLSPQRSFSRFSTGFSVNWLLPHTRPVWANYPAASLCKIGRFPERVLRISREFNTWLITVASMRLMQKSCKSNPAINHPPIPTLQHLKCPPSFSLTVFPTMVFLIYISLLSMSEENAGSWVEVNWSGDVVPALLGLYEKPPHEIVKIS